MVRLRLACAGHRQHSRDRGCELPSAGIHTTRSDGYWLYRSHAEYPSDENLRRRRGHARAPTWYHYRVLRFAHHAAILPRAPSCTRSAMQSRQWLAQHSGHGLHPFRLVALWGRALLSRCDSPPSHRHHNRVSRSSRKRGGRVWKGGGRERLLRVGLRAAAAQVSPRHR